MEEVQGVSVGLWGWGGEEGAGEVFQTGVWTEKRGDTLNVPENLRGAW